MNMNAGSYFGNSTGVQLGSGVGAIVGATLPNKPQAATPAASEAAVNNATATGQDPYSGPLAGTSAFGEPFAFWLGMILILIVLKFLSEAPDFKILGKEVNPAFIRIGGYNWAVIGVSAVTFIALLKALLNRFPVPGLTSLANAV